MTLGRGLESLIPKKHVEETPHVSPIADIPPVPVAGDGLRAGSDGGYGRRPSSSELREPLFGMRAAHSREKKSNAESIFQIEVDKIKPNPYQPRHEFNDEELKELAQSVREFGIIQPLLVTKVVSETELGTNVEYQLIAGERRLMAAKLIGLPRVPAIVRQIDEARLKLEMALIENIQRSDLSPIEAARAYARLQDEFGITQREVAMRVGKSREVIANTLRLLNLPHEIQLAMSEGRINESQARTLLAVSDKEMQLRLMNDLVREKTSVRELQKRIMTAKNPEDNYWSKQLEEKLGAPVKLVKQNGKGRLIFQFYSEEEWRGLLDRLLGGDNF